MARLTLRRAHRVLACVLAVFVAGHLGNHALILWGAQAHIEVQSWLRAVYRHPLVEPALLLAVLMQVVVGARLVLRGRWLWRFWPAAQRISGLIVALFLLQHVSAALITRALKPEIDTNVFWAAAVVSRPEFAAYFAPYYVLGVAALFVHLAAFIAARGRRRVAQIVAISGALLACVIVAGLMGVDALPATYEAYLDDFWF